MFFTEQQNLAITRTELDSVFYQEFNYEDSNPRFTNAQNASVFKQVPFDRSQYIEEIYQGSQLFVVTGETQTVPNTVPSVRNKLITPVLDFTRAIPISKDLFDDNMHDVWAQTVTDLGRKARVTIDQNAFLAYNNAFTTQLTADGVSFINAAHPLIIGGTTSNQIGGALNHANLFNAITALAVQKDQAGVILGHQPQTIVIPPALIDVAIQETDSALYADNSNNAVNVFRTGYNMTIASSPYMSAAAGGSDTAWFLLSRNHGVKRIIRQGIQTFLRDWGYSNNRTYNYQANFREAVATTDYAGSVGSVGF